MSKSNFDRKLQELARKKNIPLIGEFEITSRCNLNCVMCYTRKSPNNKEIMSKEMSKEEIIELVKEARNAGMMYLLLTGGEIFIRKDFKEIYEAISELGVVITLFTNGTLITEEIANWLGQRPPRLVSVTLYGASREVYQNITGSDNAFDDALQGVDLLLKQGIRVELKTTWVRGNVHEYYKLYDLARLRGLNLKVVNYVFPAIDSENSNPLGERLTPFDMAKMELEIEKYESQQIKTDYNSYIEKDVLEIKNNNDNYQLRVIDSAFDCDAGHSIFNVSWDGYITTCGLLQSVKYHFRVLPFELLFKKIVEDCQQIERFEICDHCEIKAECFPCPARRLLETGNVSGLPTYLCDHAKARSLLKS